MSEETSFRLQMQVWGYAVSGASDVAVRVVEPGWHMGGMLWDEDDEYLRRAGDAPPRYALWWACEHERRHGSE